MARLPRPLVRVVVAGTVRPALVPRVPVGLRRRWLDAAGRLAPPPRGTGVSRLALGGVPAERVAHRDAVRGRAVLYLHGGGFVVGSPASHRGLAARLSRVTAAPVYVPAYRRAPEHPFSAAGEDALAAYRGLLDLGYRPDQVAVAGDSAGGNLALSLALHLRDEGAAPPAALVLLSPWVDLTLSGASVAANADRDAMLPRSWLPFCVDQVRGDRDPADPALSPLFADLTGLPPLHLVAGSDELLRDDAERLAARARAAGVDVTYRPTAGLWHAFPLAAGLSADADAAVAEIGAALRRRWAGGLPSVVVVGAGLGGIGMAAALVRAGFPNVTVLDKADAIGGVWRDNTYPGAACDVPSHLYCYSFAQDYPWRHRYPRQAEVLGYLDHLVTRYGLEPHLRLGCEVTRAEFDPGRGRWVLSTAGGEVLEADVLVPATGQLSRPAEPNLPGLASFRGTAFHSARWNHDHDLAGRSVAVIGTGASAIQVVPAIADQVGRLTVFQRSAPYLIPRRDRRYRPWHHGAFRRLPVLRRVVRAQLTGYFELGTVGMTRWRGVLVLPRVRYLAQRWRQVRDPALRAALTPDHEIGCKRILVSSDFYPTLRRANVALVTAPIAEVTGDGVRTADGVEHRVDTIVFGTGFSTLDFLGPIEVVGVGGRRLGDAWTGGARAYLGIAVPGFPNMFILYGPNTNVGSGSIVTMLESQIRYVTDAVRTLATAEVDHLEVRPDVEAAFDREVQARLARSVWTRCANWYRTPDGRVVTNWPGLMAEYRRRTRRLDPADYLPAGSAASVARDPVGDAARTV